jgi:hypothetical protein
MLGWIEAQEALRVTVEQRAGRDHLGVEQGVSTDEAQKEATVAVRPIQHRSHGEATIQSRAGLATFDLVAWVCSVHRFECAPCRAHQGSTTSAPSCAPVGHEGSCPGANTFAPGQLCSTRPTLCFRSAPNGEKDSRQTSGQAPSPGRRTGTFRVTSSSALLGWIATVESRSALVAPILTATAKP